MTFKLALTIKVVLKRFEETEEGKKLLKELKRKKDESERRTINEDVLQRKIITARKGRMKDKEHTWVEA